MNYIGLQPVLVIFILKVTMAPERYFCNICGKNAEKDLIECSSCQNWVHRKCVPLSCKQIMDYTSKCLDFYCKPCSFVQGTFSFRRSLERYVTMFKYLNYIFIAVN